MNTAAIDNMTHWYVVHTHLKQEDRAGANLKSLGVPIINPKTKERRNNQFLNEPAYVTKPLFPRYIFAQFNVNDLYHKVRFTRGVYTVVSFGDGPTPIDQEIITVLQSKIRDGFVRFVEDIRPGDRVKVKSGPMKNFVGLFERELNDTDRIRILLETVSYQAHVEIERDMVKKDA